MGSASCGADAWLRLGPTGCPTVVFEGSAPQPTVVSRMIMNAATLDVSAASEGMMQPILAQTVSPQHRTHDCPTEPTGAGPYYDRGS